MENQKTKNYLTVAIGIMITLLVISGIFYMKRESDKKTVIRINPVTHEDSIEALKYAPVAVPDTTIDETVLPAVENTTTADMPDSIARDNRPPYQVGLDDGYTTGKEDVENGDVHAMYDETCSYDDEKDVADYVKGYREGYQKAIDERKKKKSEATTE